MRNTKNEQPLLSPAQRIQGKEYWRFLLILTLVRRTENREEEKANEISKESTTIKSEKWAKSMY